jgi:hypothetical protein
MVLPLLIEKNHPIELSAVNNNNKPMYFLNDQRRYNP